MMDILTADFHTHILPGLDDGSRSIDESVEMLRKEQSDGINTILLTPHFYPHQIYPETFLLERERAMSQLKAALLDNERMPLLIPGAEVQFCVGMSQWEQLDLLAIGNSKYILIELPFTKWEECVYSELTQIRYERGLIPIIAHIDRYLTFLNANRLLRRLQNIPVMMQMNCDFLVNRHTQRAALKLISENKVHFIGSDCHGSQWRPPIVAQAREILLANLNKQTLLFLRENEDLVVQNV